MGDTTAAQRWHDDLMAWAIPDELVEAAGRSPWGHDVNRFAARTEGALAAPENPSYDAAVAALQGSTHRGGADVRPTLLDVGAGAGAASLPLLGLVDALTAVDASEPMLLALESRAAQTRGDASVRRVVGRWPAVADEVGAHDVVVCHHVLFDVADIVPFVTALTAAARRRVVVEVPVVHPLTWLNPLWLRFHGIIRPERPSADDLVEVLGELGVHDVACVRWTASAEDQDTADALAERVTRRLCLPASREPEVAALLADEPPEVDRRRVTLSWAGTAARGGADAA